MKSVKKKSDEYRKSKALRKEIREKKKLGLTASNKVPTAHRRRKGNCSVSIKIKEMTPEQRAFVQERINRLFPPDRRIQLAADNKNTLKAIFGDTLAYELIAVQPDEEIIKREVMYIIPETVARYINKE